MTGRAEAGDRELDAKIAERLFGEDMSPVQHADMFPRMATAERPGIIICLRCDATWTRVEDISGVCPWGRVPDRYSSTGDGMLRVVEAMRAKGFKAVADWSSLPSNESEPCYAVFGRADLASGSARSTSMPRAVAIAALKALGVE